MPTARSIWMSSVTVTARSRRWARERGATLPGWFDWPLKFFAAVQWRRGSASHANPNFSTAHSCSHKEEKKVPGQCRQPGPSGCPASPRTWIRLQDFSLGCSVSGCSLSGRRMPGCSVSGCSVSGFSVSGCSVPGFSVSGCSVWV